MATNKIAAIINFRRIVSSLQQNEFMQLLSTICNECGLDFLRQIVLNGLQFTNNSTMDSHLKIIMKLTTKLLELQMNSPSSSLLVKKDVENYSDNRSTQMKLTHLSEIDISNICRYLEFKDLLSFELTNRYIFCQAHKSISCISLINEPNWFNQYLLSHHPKYIQRKASIDISRFNHIKHLSLILDDNQKNSIMYKAKEIARRHNWSYNVTQFQEYCDYIGYALSNLSKINPIYLKLSLHFDWGIHKITSNFPYKKIWIKTVKHIHFHNMKWNYILRFLESQCTDNKENGALKTVIFENILWENSYLSDPYKYFNYFLEMLFSGYSVIKRRNRIIRDDTTDEIDEKLQSELSKCEYAKLYDMDDVQLNGKLVQILHFTEWANAWKCKRVTPKIGYNGPINEYISVESRHLKPLMILSGDVNKKVECRNNNNLIEKVVFINMSLEKMINDSNMRSIRNQMFKVFDDIDIIGKYFCPNMRHLVYHYNGNEKLFNSLVQSIITVRSSSLESLHLQTMKYLHFYGIEFDILPYQSFDRLRELCLESSEQTSLLLQRIAISIIGFERLHLSIKSTGFDDNNQQNKIHKQGVESILNAIFSEFNRNSLQLLSFDMSFDFDAMDFQSMNFNSVDIKLNKLNHFYEILNRSIASQINMNNRYKFDTDKIPLKLKINLRYNIEIENYELNHSKRKQLVGIVSKKLNYFPMSIFELCKYLLSMRKNVMVLFKCSFSDKMLYDNSNLSLMLNDIKKNKLFDVVNDWKCNAAEINHSFQFGIIAHTKSFIDPYHTKWLCSCSYCDDNDFFN